jgi:hypothetical protein
MSAQAELRLARLVSRFYRLGDRALYELVRALPGEVKLYVVADMRRYADRLGRFRPEVLATLGADRIPPPPLHAIPRGRKP